MNKIHSHVTIILFIWLVTAFICIVMLSKQIKTIQECNNTLQERINVIQLQNSTGLHSPEDGTFSLGVDGVIYEIQTKIPNPNLKHKK